MIEANRGCRANLVEGLDGFGNASLVTAVIGEVGSIFINTFSEVPSSVFMAFLIYAVVLGAIPKLVSKKLSLKVK